MNDQWRALDSLEREVRKRKRHDAELVECQRSLHEALKKSKEWEEIALRYRSLVESLVETPIHRNEEQPQISDLSAQGIASPSAQDRPESDLSAGIRVIRGVNRTHQFIFDMIVRLFRANPEQELISEATLLKECGHFFTQSKLPAITREDIDEYFRTSFAIQDTDEYITIRPTAQAGWLVTFPTWLRRSMIRIK